MLRGVIRKWETETKMPPVGFRVGITTLHSNALYNTLLQSVCSTESFKGTESLKNIVGTAAARRVRKTSFFSYMCH